jgi:hypothetical protein
MDLTAYRVTGSNNPAKQVSVTAFNALLTAIEDGVEAVEGLASVASRAALAAIASPAAGASRVLADSRDLFLFDDTNHWDGRLDVSNNSGTTVTESSTESGLFTVSKSGGANNVYDASTRASIALTGDYEMWFKRSAGIFTIGGACNASPVGNDANDIDFGVGFGNSTVYAYTNGANVGSVGGVGQNSWYCLQRVGGTIKIYENATERSLTGATLRHTFTGTTHTGTHYHKASLYGSNDAYTCIINDKANEGTGYVQADSAQAVYVAPNSDTTGKTGAWVRKLDPGRRVAIEWFGADDTGATNSTAAFQAAARFLNKISARLSFNPIGVYTVGQQTLGGDPTNYNHAPADILRLSDFSHYIGIELNGCTIRCASGLYYGSFTPGTNTAYHPGGTFANPAYASTPYQGMIHATDFTGTLELDFCGAILDGNSDTYVLGGTYGDTGYQIACHGLNIEPGQGVVILHGPATLKDHGCDCVHYRATVDDSHDSVVRAIFTQLTCDNGGRNGFSLTGGRGVIFDACKFNNTGTGAIQSNPGYGFDMEPDSGNWARDIIFRGACEFRGNRNGGYGGGSGRMQNIAHYDSIFEDSTGYALWIEKPGHVFHRGHVIGIYNCTTWTENFSRGILEEGLEPQFYGTIFTNNPREHSGGACRAYSLGAASNVSSRALFDNCVWDYDFPAWAASTAYSAGDQVANDTNKIYRCITGGTSAASGGPTGTSTSITDGTVTWKWVGNLLNPGSTSSGVDPDRPTYRNCTFKIFSLGAIQFGGTFEGITRLTTAGNLAVESTPEYIIGRYFKNGTEWFSGSKTHDWGSIAALGVATTTVTVTGAKVGDKRTYRAHMSNGWGGLIAFAEVTANNTVTVTAFNPTGSAIDLASATLSVTGVRS